MRRSRRFSLYRRMASSSPGITRFTISETLASSSSRSSVCEVTVDTSSRKSKSSDRSRNRTALRAAFICPAASTIFTLALAPTRLAPAATMARKSSKRANASRGLHAHRRTDGVAHQHDILHGGAGGAESGGSLHEIGAGRLRQPASCNLLCDRLSRAVSRITFTIAPASWHTRVDGLDIQLYRVEIARAQSADVDHHVDLARAGAQGRGRFGHLGFRGRRAQRKTRDRADFHRRSRQFAGRQRHPIRIDAHRGEAVLPRFAAQLDDILARGFRTQHGVVDQRGDGPSNRLVFACSAFRGRRRAALAILLLDAP